MQKLSFATVWGGWKVWGRSMLFLLVGTRNAYSVYVPGTLPHHNEPADN